MAAPGGGLIRAKKVSAVQCVWMLGPRQVGGYPTWRSTDRSMPCTTNAPRPKPKPKQLHEILAGRLGGGVRAAMVFNHDGALLGAASLPSSASAAAAAAAGTAGAVGADGEAGEDGAGSVVMPSKEEAKEAQVCLRVYMYVDCGRDYLGVCPTTGR